MALWQAGIGGGQAAPLVVRREDARWVEGGLTAAGMSVLSLELLAKTAYQMGGVTGAAVHVFNRWQWAEADFTLNGKSERLPIDGMSLRNAGGEFKPLARGQVYYPPTQRNNAAVTYYSAVGTLAEVAVDIATGRGIVESPLDYGVWQPDRAGTGFRPAAGRAGDGYRPCAARIFTAVRRRPGQRH